ncbi:hypothetical protein [uncultured Paludibaculum sp.]|uniref:hypothetical protein n=1 Tax=uncultured Paludibaculum sp. TaxID=1765020 RepID=UPI002AAADAAA|nr:hypothetical protein [uncultured Paludibaculum sp.]
MRIQVLRLLAALVMLAAVLPAQKKYTGPRPAKPDVPFLVHASRLVETESNTATESQSKDGTVYTIPGATSPARTPVPEPIMVFQSDKINPDRLTLYRMDVKGGSRTLLIPQAGKRGKKDDARPLFLMVTPLAPSLFKVEVNEVLPDGEYCLSPEGSNQVFCFTSY